MEKIKILSFLCPNKQSEKSFFETNLLGTLRALSLSHHQRSNKCTKEREKNRYIYIKKKSKNSNQIHREQLIIRVNTIIVLIKYLVINLIKILL